MPTRALPIRLALILLLAAYASAGPALLVTSYNNPAVLAYDGATGAFLRVFASGGGLAGPTGLGLGPDGNLYVTSSDNRILRFDGGTGAFLNVFVSGPPLTNPVSLAWGPDRNLYTASFSTGTILKYAGATGSLLGSFGQSTSINGPGGMAFGRNGTLYVSDTGHNRVVQFDPVNGNLLNSFGQGTSLTAPTGLTAGPDGTLFVSSAGTNQVLHYNLSGGFLGVAASGAELANPVALSFGPDGNLYVSTLLNEVLRYDSTSGKLISRFVSAGSGGLNSPIGMIFSPGITAAPTGPTSIQQIGGGNQETVVNTEFADPLTVEVRSGALPVANQTVQFAITNGIGAISSPTAPTGANGRAFTRVAAGPSAGPMAVTATAGSASTVFLLNVRAVPAGVPISIKAVSGDGQEGTVNTRFKDPLTVQVNIGDQPVSGQAVHFEIANGTGALVSPNVVSDANGRAATLASAGSSAGALEIRATAGPVSILFRLIVRPAPAAEDPVIALGGVLHGARRTPMGLLNSQIALGGIFVIRGRRLGPSTRIQGSSPYPTRLPDEPSGTSVRLTNIVNRTAVDAYVISASDEQVVAIAPAATLAGDDLVSVSYQGRTSNSVKVTLVASNFGIFTRNELGNGPAVAMTIDSSGVYQAIGLATPAQAGQTVALRGTGLGPVTTAENGSSTAKFDTTDVAVLIGGISVQPVFAGRVPDLAATDEIQFRIPNDGSVPDGCYVPIAIRVGDRLSNFATIPKAPAGSAGACDHPLNLPPQTLAQLDAGGSITAGLFGITRLDLETPAGSGVFAALGGIFAKFDANSLYLPAGIATMTVTDGACTVYQASVTSGFETIFPVPLGKGLDAGASLAVIAPNLRRDSLPRRSSGAYDKSSLVDEPLLPKELRGSWTFSGQGGSEVNAFNASLELPAPISWTNRDTIGEVDRGRDLNITWQTDGEARFERVLVTGGIFRPSADQLFSALSAQFACSAPFMAGAVTIPSLILRQLPPSADEDITFLAVANSAFDVRPKTFPAQSTNATAIDATGTTYVLGAGKVVSYR